MERDGDATAAERRDRLATRRLVRGALYVGLAAVVLIGGALLWSQRPRLSEDEVRSVILASLQRETRQAFVITGSIELNVTTRVVSTRRLLPGSLNLPVGSVESTIRLPGRVSYGFPISDLREDHIRVYGDTVEMRVPDPRLFSVEPVLAQMEVETESGWLRPSREGRMEVQQRATSLVDGAFRQQALRHLQDSEQPRINTAETLHELLRPAFVAAGMREPVFRFVISDRLVYRGADR
jgi:hypothetical protein